jgi:beta-glucanase (GH16 family)
MTDYKKVLCIVMSLIICLGLAGCSKENNNDDKQWRDPKPVEETVLEYRDTDGDFEYKTAKWNGPDGYTVVYPEGDKNAAEYANLIKEYYAQSCGIELEVVSDKSEEGKKEILIGKTNRKESDKELGESELQVKVENTKLVFSAGHTLTLKSAVEKFLRLSPNAKEAFEFEVETDFVSSVLDGYEYVWGDEFEGSDLDFTKWDFEERMGGSAKIEVSWDKDVIAVEDGRLKLHALHYFNPLSEGTKYKVPYSVLTKYKMNYKYGYVEIRARIPYYEGAWPSFWALTVGGQGGNKADGGVCYDPVKSAAAKYGVEVDIFEIFGSKSVVTPGAHKWYRPNNFDYDATYGTNTDQHSMLATQKVYDWTQNHSNITNLPNEYHLYGFEWNEKEMSFYVDGEKYYSLDIVNSFDLYNDMTRFHDPIFLMFNNHVFADDIGWYENLVEDHSQMPFCYYIDYIRLYQKPNTGELHLDNTPNQYRGR